MCTLPRCFLICWKQTVQLKLISLFVAVYKLIDYIIQGPKLFKNHHLLFHPLMVEKGKVQPKRRILPNFDSTLGYPCHEVPTSGFSVKSRFLQTGPNIGIVSRVVTHLRVLHWIFSPLLHEISRHRYPQTDYCLTLTVDVSEDTIPIFRETKVASFCTCTFGPGDARGVRELLFRSSDVLPQALRSMEPSTQLCLLGVFKWFWSAHIF